MFIQNREILPPFEKASETDEKSLPPGLLILLLLLLFNCFLDFNYANYLTINYAKEIAEMCEVPVSGF